MGAAQVSRPAASRLRPSSNNRSAASVSRSGSAFFTRADKACMFDGPSLTYSLDDLRAGGRHGVRRLVSQLEQAALRRGLRNDASACASPFRYASRNREITRQMAS